MADTKHLCQTSTPDDLDLMHHIRHSRPTTPPPFTPKQPQKGPLINCKKTRLEAPWESFYNGCSDRLPYLTRAGNKILANQFQGDVMLHISSFLSDVAVFNVLACCCKDVRDVVSCTHSLPLLWRVCSTRSELLRNLRGWGPQLRVLCVKYRLGDASDLSGLDRHLGLNELILDATTACFDMSRVIFPDGLAHLRLGCKGHCLKSSKAEPGSPLHSGITLPPRLKSLIVAESFSGVLNLVEFPREVDLLDLSACDMTFVFGCMWRLPATLRVLKLGRNFNQPLQSLQIPAGLSVLHLGAATIGTVGPLQDAARLRKQPEMFCMNANGLVCRTIKRDDGPRCPLHLRKRLDVRLRHHPLGRDADDDHFELGLNSATIGFGQ